VRGLALVVGDDTDGVVERPVLGFGGLVQGWEVGSGEDRVEVFAGGREREQGGDIGGRLEDVEEKFVG